jgi:hypothetical protein
MEDAHTKHDQQRRGNNGKVTKELEKEIAVLRIACCGRGM